MVGEKLLKNTRPFTTLQTVDHVLVGPGVLGHGDGMRRSWGAQPAPCATPVGAEAVASRFPQSRAPCQLPAEPPICSAGP